MTGARAPKLAGLDVALSGDATSPPILLVRPLGGSTALWGAFAETLAEELHVVAFDARGTAGSPAAPRLSVEAMAADAHRVLEALGLRRVHVFGISLGGMVAMRLALAHPGRVRSLVLASTAARGLAFERAGLVRGLSFARCFVAADAEVCLVERVLSAAFRREHPAEVERIASLVRRAPTSRKVLAAHALAAARHDAWAELAGLRAPVLVMSGTRDHLLGPSPQRAGEALARRIAGARLEMVADAGHDLTLEQPVATARRVLAFVRAHAGSPDAVPST